MNASCKGRGGEAQSPFSLAFVGVTHKNPPVPEYRQVLQVG